MTLPVTDEYLSLALKDGFQLGSATLVHRRVGELNLPSGRIVACDPLVCPDTEPFKLSFPVGNFPVVLSVAKIGDDQRVAFSAVHFRTTAPVTWKMLTVGNQDVSKLKEGDFFGYGVDSGTGCFMDQIAGKELDRIMQENPEFFETLTEEMEKNYVHTWDWTNYKFGEGLPNLIAFSSGFGDGIYGSYAGFDSTGEVSVVVTDFGIIAAKS